VWQESPPARLYWKQLITHNTAAYKSDLYDAFFRGFFGCTKRAMLPVVLEHPFGPCLHRLRLERSVALREFASRAGLSIERASRLDRGRAMPSLEGDELDRICRALGLEEFSSEARELRSMAAIPDGSVPRRQITEEDIACLLPSSLWFTVPFNRNNYVKFRELIIASLT
jgi:transcriptional regulator with XRE-family HTH domain